MTNNRFPRVVSHHGVTLLELTIVLLLLLTLVSICFVGARAWKRGGDRASCILALRNVQMAMRSYQNLYGYNNGDRPYAENGSQNIARHLYNNGYIEKKLFNQASGAEDCSSGGTYFCPLPDIFPQPGELYMNCSFSVSENHQPPSRKGW